ncbi:MAG: thioredoxin family protein [Culicoidibacterales bacterium]
MASKEKTPMSGTTRIGLIVGGIVLAVALLVGLQFARTASTEPVLPPVTTSELATKLDNQEDFIVYIGRPTCSACVEFLPKVESAVTENGITISYYNVDDAAAEDDTAKNAMLDRLQIEGTPTLISIKGGEEAGRLVGNKTAEELATWLTEMGY